MVSLTPEIGWFVAATFKRFGVGHFENFRIQFNVVDLFGNNLAIIASLVLASASAHILGVDASPLRLEKT